MYDRKCMRDVSYHYSQSNEVFTCVIVKNNIQTNWNAIWVQYNTSYKSTRLHGCKSSQPRVK